MEMQALAGERSNSNLSVEPGTPLSHDDYKTPSPSSSQVPFFSHVPPQSKARRRFAELTTGWRFGALDIAIWASVVFVINLIITIWGSAPHSYGQGVLFEGNCNRVKRLNTGIHVLINVLSTILLGGSNYCMQCLSAPTRSEVDRAHARGQWLDIGVPSIRNIRYISRRRMVLWSLLALSSLPLHLFYNSAVFASVSSNSYFAFSVSKSFIEDTECTSCNHLNASVAYQRKYSLLDPRYPIYYNYMTDDIPDILSDLHSAGRAGKLDRLEPAACLSQYGALIQSNRRHVLLVASDEHFRTPQDNNFMPGSHVYWAAPFYADSAEGADKAADAYDWICSGMETNACTTKIDGIKSKTEDWRVGWNCTSRNASEDCASGQWPVEYCLSQKAEPRCRLQFNTTIAVVVTVLNFIKAALMFYVALSPTETPLITIGDALSSFLIRHDPYTANMCLLSRADFKASQHARRPGPKIWHASPSRWKDVTSKTRRTTTILMFLIALGIVAALLALGIANLPTDSPRNMRFLVSLGYGTVDPRTAMFGIPNSILTAALIANSPQVILSLLYVSYNALFTAMLLGREWTTYASKRAGLRVSTTSTGAQRSSYFLQLPYRVGVPLMFLSGTLHWLVSQSIFLVAIDYYDFRGSVGNHVRKSLYGYGLNDDFKTCGYSPIAIISVMILGGLMTAALVGVGFVPYKQGMTVAGSCSMAISAACHVEGWGGDERWGRREGETGQSDGEAVREDRKWRERERGYVAAVERVRWGVVSVGPNGVGHCAFSSREVKAPVEGAMYAGQSP